MILFSNLQQIYSRAANAAPCGLIIKFCVGIEEMESFTRLPTIGGSSTITNKTNLTRIKVLNQLKSIGPIVTGEGGAEDLSSILVVAFNKDLRYLNLEALEVVEGVVAICSNTQPNHINMSCLQKVIGFVSFKSNSPGIKNFFSSARLQIDESGCRGRRNEVSYITTSGGDPIFVTNLLK